jgi:chorismate--pyruvate lyase
MKNAVPVTLTYPHLSSTVGKAGVWRPVRQVLRRQIPKDTLGWLLDPGSLTRRVLAVCPGRFRVAVLYQGWRAPLLNEARFLGIDPGGYAFVREVYLQCDDQPWVYARTIIPRSTLTGRERRLAHLSARPLGEVLFADPSMARGDVEVARLRPEDGLYRIATARCTRRPPALWGRRSLFTLHGKPLLVNEIFLPPIPPCRP